MTPWTPKGPLLTFTAATTAPTSVQILSNPTSENAPVCMVTNTSSTVDVVVGWGNSDQEAKNNSTSALAAGASIVKACYVLRGTQVTVGIPNGQYVTGITASSTAAVWVQAGQGDYS